MPGFSSLSAISAKEIVSTSEWNHNYPNFFFAMYFADDFAHNIKE
jgi:hypothetical protein